MNRERSREEARLAEVEELIQTRRSTLEKRMRENQARLEEDRMTMWEDVKRQIRRGSVDEFDEMVEILQGASHLEHEENLRAEGQNELRRLERMQATPYFGRVDFKDELGEEEIYVGIGTLEDDGDFYIYDWRSPIASLYYAYGTGKASYQAPVGVIEGEITLKRQYTIEKGRLKYYFDTDVEISDGILREALSRSADGKLKTIVSTIQKEQNEAIRRPYRKNLLITGPAGCGKTAVGMHRLAWMLYENRGKMRAEDILILTQSALFGKYLAGVLPALGEQEALRVHPEEILEGAVGRLESDGIQGLTDALLSGDEKRRARAEKKLSDDFEQALRQAAEEKKVALPDIRFFDDVILTGEELSRRFAEDDAYPVGVRKTRLAAFAEAAIDSFFAVGEKDEKKPIRAKLANADYTDEAYYTPMDELVEIYRARMKAAFRNALEAAAAFDLRSRYLSLLDSDERRAFTANMEKGRIDFEDAVAMARLLYFREGRRGERTPRHILVDEAQDLPAMFHRLLRDSFPQAAFTLLADGRQGLLPGINTSEEQLTAIYGADRIRFNRSFRSTSEIASYCLTMTDADYDIFSRHGDPVEFSDETVEQAVRRALTQKGENEKLCLVTRSKKQSEAYDKAFGKALGADLITDPETTAKGNFLITPVYYTKGLEFDRVIVPTEDYQDDRRSLYMACTRALHHLTVL